MKAGAGAVLVPTIMTITARSAHAADYSMTAYKYGHQLGLFRVAVDPNMWETDETLKARFEELRVGGANTVSAANTTFNSNVYFAQHAGANLSVDTNPRLASGTPGGREIISSDWTPLAGT